MHKLLIVSIAAESIHTLNNLLSIIVGFSDCLIQDAGDSPQRSDLMEIRGAAVKALDVTRDWQSGASAERRVRP